MLKQRVYVLLAAVLVLFGGFISSNVSAQNVSVTIIRFQSVLRTDSSLIFP